MILHLTDELRAEYLDNWNRVQCRDEDRPEAIHLASQIMAHKIRYSLVESSTGVPWWVIAGLHNMECSLSFFKHLHNGDSLSRKTRNDPSGRPPSPGPWTWEESAIDALHFDHFDIWHDWGISGALYKAELYNGTGYRGHNVRSPYLYGGSNLEQPGKYIADRIWSATATTDQLGVATLWHTMEWLKMIQLEHK